MIKGVNLGNWLVLEKWMSPELFAGTTAEDETYLCKQLDDEAKHERFTVHRDSYITDRDFAYLASKGIDFVRLPVPFFVFGDYEPYVGCVDYVDKAFRWGEMYGVKILVTLHTVPDSQNGFDNGGICGVCKFHKNPKHVEFALDVLEQLTKRYRDNEYLWGIEVLNEPVSPELWEGLDVPKRYPAVDKEYAKGSEAVPTEFLKGFYKDAYARIRSQSEDVQIVFHDGFRIKEWVGVLTEPDFKDFIVDTHMYVMGASIRGDQDLSGNLAYIEEKFEKTLEEMSQHFPLLVGEWNLDSKSKDVAALTGEPRRDYYRAIADAHFKAWEHAFAWSYWAYKHHGDAPEDEVWDLLKTIELGYFPDELPNPPSAQPKAHAVSASSAT